MTDFVNRIRFQQLKKIFHFGLGGLPWHISILSIWFEIIWPSIGELTTNLPAPKPAYWESLLETPDNHHLVNIAILLHHRHDVQGFWPGSRSELVTWEVAASQELVSHLMISTLIIISSRKANLQSQQLHGVWWSALLSSSAGRKVIFKVNCILKTNPVNRVAPEIPLKIGQNTGSVALWGWPHLQIHLKLKVSEGLLS